MGMGLTLVLLVKIGVIGARGDKIPLDKVGSGFLVTFLSANEVSTFDGDVVAEGKGGISVVFLFGERVLESFDVVLVL